MAILLSETCRQCSVIYQQLYVVFECAHLSTIIHNSLRDFRPLRYINRDSDTEGELVNRGRGTHTLQFLARVMCSEGS
jgi:hypothetical protein